MGNTSGKLVQEDVDAMLKTTAFTEQELRRLFVRFRLSGADPLLQHDHEPHIQALFDRFYQMLSRLPEKDQFAEFVGTIVALSDNTPATDEAKLKFAFSVFDTDGDGYISNGELFNTLKILIGDITPEELQQVCDRTIIDFNKSGEGKISFEDFKTYFGKSAEDIIEKLTITWQ